MQQCGHLSMLGQYWSAVRTKGHTVKLQSKYYHEFKIQHLVKM